MRASSFFWIRDFLHLDDFVKCRLIQSLLRTNCSQGPNSPFIYQKFGFNLSKKKLCFRRSSHLFLDQVWFSGKTMFLDNNRIKKLRLFLQVPAFCLASVTCVQLLDENHIYGRESNSAGFPWDISLCFEHVYVAVLKLHPWIKYRKIPLLLCFSFTIKEQYYTANPKKVFFYFYLLKSTVSVFSSGKWWMGIVWTFLPTHWCDFP